MDVTVVVPVFRNADTIAALARRLCAALGSAFGEFRVLFVVDASPDASWDVVRDLAAQDARISGLLLDRRVGQHAAALMGLGSAASRWFVVMDADLQDPPEAVPLLLARARELGGTVFASRNGRYERWDRLVTSRVYKTVLRCVSGVPESVGTFFVVDAGVADAMRRTRVSSPQAVILAHHCSPAWDVVAVTRAQRAVGRSAYSSTARVRIALRSLRCAIECRRSSSREGTNAPHSVAPVAQRVNL
jgi:glycosyltransferase involved in cell wall biosynthesis